MTASLRSENAWLNQQVRTALTTGSHTDLLKALAEAFPGCWFFTRMDATFAFVNQTACDSLGYTREELMALRLFDVNPTLTPQIWNSLNITGQLTPTPFRTFHRRKDGSVFPVEAFASRIILDGEMVSISHVVDLSEEVIAKQSLTEKQHMLQSVLDNAPLIVWCVDKDGRFQLSEGSALSLVGLVPGQVIGMTVEEVFPMLRDMVEATRRALLGSPVEGIVSVDNSEFEYRYLPWRDETGAVMGAIGVAVDITSRRSAERAQMRLLTAFDQSEDPFLLLDKEGRIEHVNAAFECASGLSKDKAQGQAWPDLFPSCRADARAQTALAQAIAGGVGWRGIIKHKGSSKDERALQSGLSPFHDRSGSLSGFVASYRDITEQTQTEERLRQVEKMDALGQLAGGVAHDFNNLLQIVNGNAELCLSLDSLESIRAMIAEIQEAGARATSLVKQLLAFSKNIGEPKIVSVDRLLERMLPLLRRLLGEHVLVQVGHQGSGFDVWGDESQLEQVFANLCVNARDAMVHGGRLDIQLSCCSIGVDELDILGLSTPGAYVALDVTDTGSGMSEETRRRIFEPFFTTKPTGVGTGLGLATVYSVAKRHGGSVEVWSQLGKGTRFRVLLRQSERGEETPGPTRQAASKRIPRLRVLLAENDPSVRKVTNMFLAAAGHEVTEVGDGEEALSRIKSFGASFDLLVLDAIMPKVNGTEVYTAFRSLSTAPVLFVSGHDFSTLNELPHDRSRGLLSKPFGASELADAISKLVRR